MKIKNLAFCGVMASILGVGAAYADNDATIIASKAYVDAQNALDEKVANKEAVDYSAVTDKNSTTKYPSMKTLTTAINSVDLSDTLDSLDYTDTGDGVVKTVTQDNGQIAVTKGTVATSEIADSAVTEGKINNGAVTINKVNDTAKENNNVVTSTNTTLLPTVAGVQKGVAYLKSKSGTAADGFQHSAGITYDAVKPELSWSLADTDDDAVNTIIKTNMDDYVPTVAAVEARVQQAEANAANNIQKETDNVLASENTSYLPTVGAVKKAAIITNAASVDTNATTLTINSTDADDKHIYTAEATAAGFTAVNTAIGNMQVTDTATNQAVVAVNQTNGKITPTRGTITYKDGLDYKLSEINANGDASTASENCTKGSPCVLTMVMDSGSPVYEWTNMDTDGLDAVL